MKRKLLLLTVLFGSFAFNSDAQLLISIGSPVDATEGSGAMVSFDIFIEGGGLSASDITGTISYSGTASSITDFVSVTSFSIPAGLNSTTISLPVIDDAIVEPTESVIAILTGTPSLGTYANTSSMASIFDDDSAGLLISINSPVDGTEGTSDVSFDIEIVAGGTSAAPITGNIAFTGTAIDGSDYSGVYVYTISAGNTSTTITIPVIDDFITEPIESVIANLTGTPSIGSYINTSSTAYIFDDDASNLSLSIGSAVDGVEGGSGDISFVVSLDLGAVNNTGSPIFGSIGYSGTATSGSDYVNGPLIFNILDGESTDTIVLTVIDDLCIEFTESIMATISQPSVGTISVNDTATAYIMDNDLVSASISIGSPVDGAEPSSNVSFVVSIDGGLSNCTGVPITGVLTTGGTATPSIDYVSTTAFSIPDGASFVQVDFLVIDDILIEPTESVIATISSPSIGVISAASVDTAYIVDNDSTNGFDDLYLNNLSVTLYPNPVNSTLNIRADKQMQDYSITDLNGRVMASGILTTKDATLDVDTLPKGFYFVAIEFEDGSTAIKKVLKQ